MSRTLSSSAVASINGSETAEVWLPLVELTHSDWSEPVRLARNTEDVTSNGALYLAYPFDISLPDDEVEQTAVVQWVAWNAGNDIVDLFRSVSGPVSGSIFWVLASSPDTVEIGPLNLQIRGFEYTATQIKGAMVIEPIMDAVFGDMSMDAINAPGLF